MRDFFKGWRRKLGVLTLGMACVFAAGWVRSIQYRDGYVWYQDEEMKTYYRFESNASRLLWLRVSGTLPTRFFGGPGPRFSRAAESIDFFEGKSIAWRRSYYGIEFVKTVMSDEVLEAWIIPYWSIVTPLTLLTAYLLLAKSRALAPMKTTEPAPTTGA